ncbi:hypothetical protein Prudu_279S000100, partial [Prunus dulcis]
SGHGRTRDRSRLTRLDARSSSARFPRRKPRTPAARSTGSNRNCSAVAPPPPPPKLDVIFIPINGSYLEIGVSTARTQQAGPSRGQAAWDYLGDSAKILVESLEF